MKKLIVGLVAGMLVASVAIADEGPSVEKGKELFESRRLGTNGKSCAECHPGGRKLEWAATQDEAKLARTINNCIQKPLKGKPLPLDSVEMRSLVMYIQQFGNPTR